MNNFRRLAIASVALALGVPAIAQNADVAPPASSNDIVRPAPVRIVKPAGSVKTIAGTLYSNQASLAFPAGSGAAYITKTGAGTGGADVSELYTTQAYNIYGWGAQSTATINNSMFDDFTVTGGSWTVQAVRWAFYQTGAPTSGSIVDMTHGISAGTPHVPGAGTFQFNNVTGSKSWSGVYRVLDSDLTAVSRALIECITPTVPNPVLAPGLYWIDGQAIGTAGFSGPWTPATTVPAMASNNTFGTTSGWNAQQSIGGGPPAPVTHGNGDAPDMVFALDGTGGGTGAPKFCNPQTGNGLGSCGSVALNAASGTASKSGGPGSYNITTSGINGPSIGLMLYRNNTPNPAVQLQYGDLCVAPFFRAKDDVQVIPAAAGCSLNWVIDGGQIIANYAQIAPPPAGTGLVSFQFWLRDSGATNGAVWTEGLGAITITP